MKGICEICGKESEELEIMLYNNDENKYLCPNCWDMEGARGDMENERQKEEYWIDNPEHERDIPTKGGEE